MIKTVSYYLAMSSLCTLSACNSMDKHLQTTPSARYGLDAVKLGDSRLAAGQRLEEILMSPLQCYPAIATIKTGGITASLTAEECVDIPKQGVTGKLWGEQLTSVQAVFVENELHFLNVHIQLSNSEPATVDALTTHLSKLLGTPSQVSKYLFIWERQGDQATMQSMSNKQFAVVINIQEIMNWKRIADLEP